MIINCVMFIVLMLITARILENEKIFISFLLSFFEIVLAILYFRASENLISFFWFAIGIVDFILSCLYRKRN